MKNTQSPLTQTEKEVIKSLVESKYSQTSFDRLSNGKRCMNAIATLLQREVVVVVKNESFVHQTRRRMGHWTTEYVGCLTIKLADDYKAKIGVINN